MGTWLFGHFSIWLSILAPTGSDICLEVGSDLVLDIVAWVGFPPWEGFIVWVLWSMNLWSCGWTCGFIYMSGERYTVFACSPSVGSCASSSVCNTTTISSVNIVSYPHLSPSQCFLLKFLIQ